MAEKLVQLKKKGGGGNGGNDYEIKTGYFSTSSPYVVTLDRVPRYLAFYAEVTTGYSGNYVYDESTNILTFLMGNLDRLSVSNGGKTITIQSVWGATYPVKLLLIY